MIEGLYLITPQGAEEHILKTVSDGLLGGARIVQFRDKQRSPDARVDLAHQLVRLCKAAGAVLRAGGQSGHQGQGGKSEPAGRRNAEATRSSRYHRNLLQ